jgi:hypothetical protein
MELGADIDHEADSLCVSTGDPDADPLAVPVQMCTVVQEHSPGHHVVVQPEGDTPSVGVQSLVVRETTTEHHVDTSGSFGGVSGLSAGSCGMLPPLNSNLSHDF